MERQPIPFPAVVDEPLNGFVGVDFFGVPGGSNRGNTLLATIDREHEFRRLARRDSSCGTM